eukprot:scaffold142187_cov15-Tisochrysis_lutea.AAC.2
MDAFKFKRFSWDQRARTVASKDYLPLLARSGCCTEVKASFELCVDDEGKGRGGVHDWVSTY